MVPGKNLFSVTRGNMLFYVWEIFWSKIFFPATPKIKSMMDKSVAKVFTTVFHKVKPNLGW